MMVGRVDVELTHQHFRELIDPGILVSRIWEHPASASGSGATPMEVDFPGRSDHRGGRGKGKAVTAAARDSRATATDVASGATCGKIVGARQSARSVVSTTRRRKRPTSSALGFDI